MDDLAGTVDLDPRQMCRALVGPVDDRRLTLLNFLLMNVNDVLHSPDFLGTAIAGGFPDPPFR